jgi:hypothetical protein
LLRGRSIRIYLKPSYKWRRSNFCRFGPSATSPSPSSFGWRSHFGRPWGLYRGTPSLRSRCLCQLPLILDVLNRLEPHVFDDAPVDPPIQETCEKRASDEVADHGGDEVETQEAPEGRVCAEHEADGAEEHVGDDVLEAGDDESTNWPPNADDLGNYVLRRNGEPHGHANEPVAGDAAEKHLPPGNQLDLGVRDIAGVRADRLACHKAREDAEEVGTETAADKVAKESDDPAW